MVSELNRDSQQLREEFFNWRNPDDVAVSLEVSAGYLYYLIRQIEDGRQYTTVEIHKRTGGTRQLRVPSPALKSIQRKLRQILESVYIPRHSTHGFVKGRSILTNARAHLKYRKRTYVLNVDIKDFFPTIPLARVRHVLMSHPFRRPPQVATLIARLCCSADQLPQGAPTSPILSNMICINLDRELQGFARDHGCFYTRYADDLTFSTTRKSMPRSVIEEDDKGQFVLGNGLSSLIERQGFTINDQKIKLQTIARRQEVTGIIVNEIANVPRWYLNQIRAMLHAWEKYGYEKAQDEHLHRWRRYSHQAPYKSKPLFRAVVHGKIEYVGMVRGKDSRVYKQFRQKLDALEQAMADRETTVSKPPLVQPMREQAEATPAPVAKKELSKPSQPEDVSWAKRLLREDFVILDYETTDIEGEPIQIALVDGRGRRLINQLVRPSLPIHPKAQAIHGISIDDVRDKPTFVDLYPRLKQLLQNRVVVAYNAEYERKTTARTLALYGLSDIPGITWQCAMLEYVKVNPNKRTKWGTMGGWWKLTEAVEQERISVEGVPHDALVDVRMTLLLILAMAQRY